MFSSSSTLNLGRNFSPLGQIDQAYKNTYLELMALPGDYSFKDLRFVFEHISKKYHRYRTHEEKTFFESVYYSLVTEAYDYLKDLLKEDLSRGSQKARSDLQINQDVYLKKFTLRQAEILAKLKDLYKELCVSNPTSIIQKQDLKKKYLVYTVTERKTYPGLKQLYKQIYHNEKLEEDYLLDKISKNQSTLGSKQFFDEQIKDKRNAYFELNFSLDKFLSVLLGKNSYYQEDINYEYESEKKKSFLCCFCTFSTLNCKKCNNTKRYEKVIKDSCCESLELQITKEDLKKGFMIVPNKGNIINNSRGYLLLKLNLGDQKNSEIVKIKNNDIWIIKKVPFKSLTKIIERSEDLELPIYNLNKLINVRKIDLTKIPHKQEITSYITNNKINTDIKFYLLITLSLP